MISSSLNVLKVLRCKKNHVIIFPSFLHLLTLKLSLRLIHSMLSIKWVVKKDKNIEEVTETVNAQ